MFKSLFASGKDGPGYRAHVLTDAQTLDTKADTVIKLQPQIDAGWPVEAVAAGVRVSEGSVLALSAAWACVNLMAGTIASLPLMVYRTDSDGNRRVARDHPLYTILHDSPNYDQTAYEFWEGGQSALEMMGNQHARIVRSGSRIVALNPIIKPSARRMTDGSIRYRWTEGGRTYDEPQENVFHIRGFGGSPLGGLSTLAYGRQVFGLASAVNTAAASHFRNGARPSLALSTDKFLNEKREMIEKGIEEKHAGAMNSGRPLILEGGLTPHNLSFSPEDAQMLESRGFSVEEVCRFFGTPPHLIGHTSGNTALGSSIEDQTLSFEKYALRRRLTRNEQAMRKQLLTAADRASGYTIEYNIEGLMRGNSAGRAAFYKAMADSGFYTINEVRRLENLPPVEGGDVPRVQMQNMPINMTVAPKLIAGGGE